MSGRSISHNNDDDSNHYIVRDVEDNQDDDHHAHELAPPSEEANDDQKAKGCCAWRLIPRVQIAIQIVNLMLFTFADKFTALNTFPTFIQNVTCALQFNGTNCTDDEVVVAASWPLMESTLGYYGVALFIVPLQSYLADTCSQKAMYMVVTLGVIADNFLMAFVAQTPTQIVWLHSLAGLCGNLYVGGVVCSKEFWSYRCCCFGL